MRKVFIVIAFMVFKTSVATCQIMFHFVPEAYARNLDALSMVQIRNVSGAISGQIIITVQENSKRVNIVEISTPVMLIKQGSNTIPKNVFGNSILKFGNNSYGRLVNQTRNFPPGDYSICFAFIPAEKGAPDYENCFDAMIEPLIPMQLMLPANLDTICLKRPVLSWQPPMPYNGSIYFRLMLTEKKQSGIGVEAMLKNAPLLLLDNISATTVMYPSNYPELKEGGTYFWQVVAYQQNIIISTSEIWQFTVKCKEDLPVNNDSYRELKLLVNGNYYITGDFLKFSFLNAYHVKRLQYAIVDIEDGGKLIKKLPDVALSYGLNKVDIDISDIGLTQGKTYLLKVFPFNEPPVEVRFVYK